MTSADSWGSGSFNRVVRWGRSWKRKDLCSGSGLPTFVSLSVGFNPPGPWFSHLQTGERRGGLGKDKPECSLFHLVVLPEAKGSKRPQLTLELCGRIRGAGSQAVENLYITFDSPET